MEKLLNATVAAIAAALISWPAVTAVPALAHTSRSASTCAP